ncbi:short chain dehydrogenase/reductase family oxidoreductase [Penicillium malachiteum]|uniref:short chain dehydrogenase/reductase family oxidoreductase n=1 Tax=Penicillium malachiteum TaxID=1324776 RepID=UPI0025484F3A|nr:short chain dehydrogenase/reductase family oxidoreductase [Penicillium malachiteum]KAJ5736899.1 short chain dehydrogenase/reductase family oxidoreductase [Penicillium malachiteum]
MAFFVNKLIVVSGAASGIGRATAKLLAKNGALLSLSDIDAGRLKTVKTEIDQFSPESNSITSVVDVSSQDQVSNWIRNTVAHFEGRPITAAANMAGVTGTSQVPVSGRNISDSELDFVWGANVRGVINCLRAELLYLQEGIRGRGGGAIVNAASLSGQVGLPGFLPYVSGKHAVIGITRTTTKEEGAKGIRVNAIAPAMINTPLLEEVANGLGTSLSAEMFGGGSSPALGRLGDAEEVAELVLFLLGPQSGFISGSVINIDGGMSF